MTMQMKMKTTMTTTPLFYSNFSFSEALLQICIAFW